MRQFSKRALGFATALILIGSTAFADPRGESATTSDSSEIHGVGVMVALSTRMLYLLENVSSTLAISYFQSRYPLVDFTQHPTMNGFYARGSKEEMLAIKQELADIMKAGEVPPPLPVSKISLRHVTSQDALRVLRQRVLAVECKDSPPDTVLLMGSPELRHKAALALKEIDRPSIWIKLPREQLALIPASSCQLPPRGSNPPFTCPRGNCQGILHLLGLRSGDQIHQSENNEPGHPMWVVTRNRTVMNIYVEFF